MVPLPSWGRSHSRRGLRPFGPIQRGMDGGKRVLQVPGQFDKRTRQGRGSGDQNIVVALAS